MKLSRKITISSIVCAAILLAGTLLVSDNNSWIFRCLLWLGSMAIAALLTPVGAIGSYLLSQIVYGLVRGFNSLFEPVESSYEKKERFLSRFYWGFFFFSLVILAKFTSDFIFAQFTVVQLFFSGALGFAHGTLTMIFFHHSNRIGSMKLLK